MPAEPLIERAHLQRACCNYADGQRGTTARAFWELYLVVYDAPGTWPSRSWPASRRHHIPTLEERTKALAELGFQPAPHAAWEWQESAHDTDGLIADIHGHPSEPSVFAVIAVVPLTQATGEEKDTGGDLQPSAGESTPAPADTAPPPH
ncbi:DUF6303 family protein [Streptomyces sp. NPDC005385]|uniref:DUF6303 family protein n=1 Tax=Streptomyces sp. NPDC005385 TaxID=3157039 RepID=UPI0033B572E1